MNKQAKRAAEQARDLLDTAAGELSGSHPDEQRFQAIVTHARNELDRIATDAAFARDPGLLVWRFAIPGTLAELGREELADQRVAPGWLALIGGWAALGATVELANILPSRQYGYVGIGGLAVAVLCLVIATAARARRAAVRKAAIERHHRLVALEGQIIGPISELRAATRPDDFVGPASRAAGEISESAARLDAAAKRLGGADAIVDRLGSIVSELVAALPDITGDARAVAEPFTQAADRIERSTAVLGAAADALSTATVELHESVEKANWLALVADGLRNDPLHVDPVADR